MVYCTMFCWFNQLWSQLLASLQCVLVLVSSLQKRATRSYILSLRHELNHIAEALLTGKLINRGYYRQLCLGSCSLRETVPWDHSHSFMNRLFHLETYIYCGQITPAREDALKVPKMDRKCPTKEATINLNVNSVIRQKQR